MPDDYSSFVCVKCEKSREESLRVRDKRDCKICDGFRRHLYVANPMSFDEFEAAYMERRRLEAEGKKVCPKCNTEFPADTMKKYGCADCDKEYRRVYKIKERSRAAARSGKAYTPMPHRQGHNTHEGALLIPARKNIAGSVWYFRSCAELERAHDGAARQNAEQALRWWLKECATDEYVERWYAATGKPWNNPRLSEAEKYAMRYRMDAEFQLKERIRRQITKKKKRDGISETIRSAIRRNGKSKTVEMLLGYTIEQLKDHLQGMFRDGMTWDAFMSGDIHIDHLVPQSAFDMSDDDQFRACWELSNLQPLWAEDNLAKSDMMPCGARGRENTIENHLTFNSKGTPPARYGPRGHCLRGIRSLREFSNQVC